MTGRRGPEESRVRLEWRPSSTTNSRPDPAGSESRIQFEQSMHSLKKQLKDAVEKEDYEKAAEIRDKLRDLENQTKSIV